MPVQRCPNCGRGIAGYLDGEKELPDLTVDEICTEIRKYEAKENRIRQYMAAVQAGAVTLQIYPDGISCQGCGNGWRESIIIEKTWSN